jgi:hypothetical protein
MKHQLKIKNDYNDDDVLPGCDAIGIYPQIHMVSQPRRTLSFSLPLEPQISHNDYSVHLHK